MSGATTTNTEVVIPEFKQIMGHPAPLWMLFMTEFWERFAFYGIRWALVLYVVAQFYAGAPTGEAPANLIYGSYLALVYAAALFGGYVADRVLGYQRSILVGASFMAAGLFMIAFPNQTVFQLGLATVIVGNGMFKPNISTMVGKLYGATDPRRDSGFTIFYMGINSGAMVAPLLTEWLATTVFGVNGMPAYKVVFMSAGVGMLISLVWFLIGRRNLKGIGAPDASNSDPKRVVYVVLGSLCVIPVVYFLLAAGANNLQIVLSALFILLSVMLLIEGIKNGKVARDKVIAMLLIFFFNIMFWMFFEQAGSSFTFLADKIVNRQMFNWTFPVAWFQIVNSLAIISCAPIVAFVWVAMRNKNPSIPRKFGLGLLFNGSAFGLLMFALSSLVSADNHIPFWTLVMVYVLQSIGELCLSPIGLSMVTKLAPTRLVGLGMGGWFLSTGIGNNLSGIFASAVSGESGMSVTSALSGYTFGFWSLMAGGVLLFLIAPLIQKLMHGVK
ncbi:MFS transporter [Duganella sp. BJB488]|uniref:peptide MFS transporter n=1 Tax=unclassified Duganella TaxID=2636909 RepID=UPI000E345222|nr:MULTISPECIES: oligopeptide:H+ symporter [unclassified Duganella]NVD74440.1 MFS transporter [Duganella sp. BJB1802]RFP21742.1 MFS transporter [Duganella sp. BJB489]RFP23534.1 MFS transporter [Duganella sp. BJB488]RFP38701.1 MFS transporter [Duganella sp. BJB480]